MFLSSRRLPALFGLTLAGLLALQQRVPLPQSLADEGYRRLWAGAMNGPQGAVAAFQQALISDPAFPYRWSDLGQALAAAGQTAQAQYCFNRAVERSPEAPQMAFRAASFYFGSGQTDAGLRLGAKILHQIPDYDDMIFGSYLRFAASGPSWDIGIGAGNMGNSSNARAAESFFRFLLSRDDLAAGTLGWGWLEAHELASRTLARAWVEWLLARNHPAQALAVWRQHIGPTSGVFNPGFETATEGDGFDWQVQPSPGVKVTPDDTVRHSGTRSLRLEFAALDNLDYHHLSQRVFLQPGRYELSAWIKTESLSTDEGLAWKISGAATEVRTPAVTGTHSWTRVAAVLNVPSPARVVTVQMVRKPSWHFDNQPRGTVWTDDLELRRMDP